MYTIKCHFERFADVDLSELLGAIGVYVIWDARAQARPTYIGEGTILRRFAEHVDRDGRRFAHPWNGYVAVLMGSSPGVHKDEARAVERVLLDIASMTDRMPSVNAHPGAASVVADYCRGEMLKIVVSGYDPLMPPRGARPLPTPKAVKVRATVGGGYAVDAEWRYRRVRAPII